MTRSDGTTLDDAPGAAELSRRERTYLDVLLDALSYARERDYTGWDYADGMSSRLRRWLPFETRWTNLAFQETVKRAPVNVRPLLLVEQRRSYKGAALFAMANLTVHRLLGDSNVGRDRVVDYAAEARTLLDWLVENQCPGYSGFCGAHQHEIQTLSNKGDPSTPSVVSTAYPARALLEAADLDPDYPTVGRTAADFVVEDLAYREVPGGAKIRYLPTDSEEYFTPNAAALGARLLLDVHSQFGDTVLVERAREILDYVATLQTDDGGWYYRDPPDASHLSKDNFHNGFIVEAYLRYTEVVDAGRYDDVLGDALGFYRRVLFEPDGAPNWDEDSPYPRDIHAAAQGILVFAYAGEYEFARRIIEWTRDNLYSGDGRFHYRKHRFYTKRFTLMRWCQAWMAYAIAEYLARRNGMSIP